jgi:hypothetical protein
MDSARDLVSGLWAIVVPSCYLLLSQPGRAASSAEKTLHEAARPRRMRAWTLPASTPAVPSHPALQLLVELGDLPIERIPLLDKRPHLGLNPRALGSCLAYA